jgi:hypothetical protein
MEKLNLNGLILVVGFLVLLSALSLFLGSMKGGCNKEGFETIPLQKDPTTQKIVAGYYQVDSTSMAAVPNGYKVDPNNPMKIIPVTDVAKLSIQADLKVPVPENGLPMPDGYYKLTDSSLAILPPNMMPLVNSVDFTQDTPSRLKINYGLGYVSSNQYYAQIYTPISFTPTSIPASSGVYFTNTNKTQVSFLPYGKLPNTEIGYGLIDNPSLKSNNTVFNAQTKQYRDISDNYNTQFHETAEDLQKKNESDLNYGQVRVKDQNGNMLILPYVPTQDKVTYYQPGEFPFGSSNYVPNYEDSVYLSTITNQPIVSAYANGTKPVEACKAYKDLKAQMERYCS